jgi:hypothetical protein
MVLNSSEMTNADDETRWIHSDTDLLSGHGVSYDVNVITLFIFYYYLNLLSFFYLSTWALLKYFVQ